tara:strand:- start:769 stop:927 length:159 start_codon:yes stop_codon:yes gene_type:complete
MFESLWWRWFVVFVLIARFILTRNEAKTMPTDAFAGVDVDSVFTYLYSGVIG